MIFKIGPTSLSEYLWEKQFPLKKQNKIQLFKTNFSIKAKKKAASHTYSYFKNKQHKYSPHRLKTIRQSNQEFRQQLWFSPLMLTSMQSSMVPSSNVWQLWQQLHQNLTYLYDCWFPTWHASPSQKSQESNSILSHKTEGHGRNSPLSWRATCCNYFKLLDTNLFLQAEKKTTSIPVQNQSEAPTCRDLLWWKICSFDISAGQMCDAKGLSGGRKKRV